MRIRDAPLFHAPAIGKRREERLLDVCEGMIDIAAALFNVPGRELRRAGRSQAEIVRVRQIAMYVAHVALRISMKDVGRGFGRDRTTVAYACHTVEDLRDNEEYDRLVAMTEKVALAAFRNRVMG
jgi:chromosomal replication initiation ATPase DnaA